MAHHGRVAHAVVVGGGPAGAALAYLLVSRGVETTLIERQSDFAREFRGEILVPSGQAVFAQMGLRDEFEALPHAEPTQVDLHPGRTPTVHVDFGEDLAGGPRAVSQPHLLEMLVAKAQEYPGFHFQRGVQVSDVLRDADRVRGVRLGDGTEIRGDFVVGADGRGSVVRRKTGLETPHDIEAFDVVWFKVPYPDFLTARGSPVQAYFSKGHLALAFPAPGGRDLQVAWIIQKGTFGELRRQGIEAWVREMSEYVHADLARHLRKYADRLEHPFVLDVVCYLLPRWWVPGAALVGDACHPMSPVGGQGINIALRDVVVFANHVLPVVTGDFQSDRLDTAFQAYCDERYPEVEEVQAFQRAAPKVIFQQSWWSPVVPQVFRILRFAPVRRWIGRHLAPTVLQGTRTVELNV